MPCHVMSITLKSQNIVCDALQTIPLILSAIQYTFSKLAEIKMCVYTLGNL